MKRRRFLTTVVLGGLLVGVFPWAAVTAAGNQSKCPVLGGAIDRKVYTDYQGQRVYFCCPGCIDEFRKDPEKYLKKLKEQGVELDRTPTGN